MSLILDLAKTEWSSKVVVKSDIPTILFEENFFADGEYCIDILTSVRGQRVFILKSLDTPSEIFNLFIVCDALRRASAKEIVLVSPYLPYSRQDRKAKPRHPISAKVLADTLQSVGVTRVITVDLHAMQIVGFYNIPVDNIEYVYEILRLYPPRAQVVVSPDHGGVARATTYAELIKAELAVIDKRRVNPNEVHSMRVIGDVKGKSCVIVDDMIDTGGTIVKAARLLVSQGVTSVVVLATHGVFSGSAISRLNDCDAIDGVIVSDTHRNAISLGKIMTISIGPLISRVIEAVDNDRPLSKIINSNPFKD